jgi:hypothetical protein
MRLPLAAGFGYRIEAQGAAGDHCDGR